MITMWDVYWFTRLDSLIGLCIFFIVVFATMLIVMGIFAVIEDRWEKVKKSFMICAATMTFFIILATFLPSTKEAVAIYILPKIVNNEQIQKLPDNALQLMNTKMEEWIKDMTKEKRK